MMRYSTFKKWEPMVNEYECSGGGSKLAFCQEHNRSHYQFCSVMRAIRYGLSEPEKQDHKPDPETSASDLSTKKHIHFLKVVVEENTL